MSTAAFTEFPGVVKAMEKLKAGFIDQGKQISDIVDDAGHQYVDLVMEGGGVLGIALAGYTYALEQAGVRFLGVAGTSAGAINALLVAAADTPENEKSGKIVKILSQLDLYRFVDGDEDVQDFIKSLLDPDAWMITKIKNAAFVKDTIDEDVGLNPGVEFQLWMVTVLKSFGVTSLQTLRDKMVLSGLKYRDTGQPISSDDSQAKLALIAADLTTETKVEFPRMAELYWKDLDSVNPAVFARASMSVPVFFKPLKIEDCPTGEKAKENWYRLARYKGDPPDEVTFVDGGILSNFPIDVFHKHGEVPKAPTFGAKLGIDRTKPRDVSSLLKLIGGAFDAARHCLDYDFLLRNDDYEHLITRIQTGDHNWLNFAMEEKDQVDLFYRGVQHGVDFLLGFDWEKYKEIRRNIKRTGA